jgi:hypothetical protein
MRNTNTNETGLAVLAILTLVGYLAMMVVIFSTM